MSSPESPFGHSRGLRTLILASKAHTLFQFHNRINQDDDMTAPAQFYGDGRKDENPHDFLKAAECSFTRATHAMTEAEKVCTMYLNMVSGGVAEVWMDALPANELDTWSYFCAAFTVRWPKRVMVQQTAREKVQELHAELLKEDKLGQHVETSGGSRELSHVVWARRVLELVMAVGDVNGLIIAEVHARLPSALREIVPDTFQTWASFTDAVKAVTVNEIADSQKREARLKEIEGKLKHNNDSPSGGLRQAMGQMSLGRSPYATPPQMFPQSFPAMATQGPRLQHVPQQQIMTHNGFSYPVTTMPFGGPPMAPSAHLARGPQQAQMFRPVEERYADMMKNVLPHHPATDEGKRLYTRQVEVWMAANPKEKPDECCPFPLTPGSLPLGSGECFTCGDCGHRAQKCTGLLLPPLEMKWRSIAGWISNNYRRAQPRLLPR